MTIKIDDFLGACKRDDWELVEKVLANNENSFAIIKFEAIHLAAENCSIEVMKLLACDHRFDICGVISHLLEIRTIRYE